MLQPRSLKGEAFNPDPRCRNMAAGGFGELYPPLKPPHVGSWGTRYMGEGKWWPPAAVGDVRLTSDRETVVNSPVFKQLFSLALHHEI